MVALLLVAVSLGLSNLAASVGGGLLIAYLPTGRLLATALALSVDNLAVGFAPGTYRISVIVAAVVIGLVSAGLSLLGWNSAAASAAGPARGAR